jgi:exodeoxyribonuclease VII large subunit
MPEEPDLARISTAFPSEILSVSQLNRSVRDLVERRFPLLWVKGEISNCLVARSGHAYFVLKDSQAQVRCVMFRSRVQQHDAPPSDGMQVEVRGLLTLYEARGDFQLVVEALRQSGRGSLYEAFLRLRDRLQAEGLFDEAVKRAPPFLPRAIGIVTSLQAAALSDVLTTLRRRNPSIPVVVYPTAVQGPDAAPGIVRALRTAARRQECDVLVLCRGGGSLEDLWPFNEEAVARAIRACPMAVVCGVGHETDFSIADFAADRRAPTPTAAAELVSPSRTELLQAAAALARRMRTMLGRELDTRSQSVDLLARRLSHPAQRLAEQGRLVAQLRLRLARSLAQQMAARALHASALARRMQPLLPRTSQLALRVRSIAERLTAASLAVHARREARLAALGASLEHLSPMRVLERGYSLVQDHAGRIVTDAASLQPGMRIELKFMRGRASALIDSTRDS